MRTILALVMTLSFTPAVAGSARQQVSDFKPVVNKVRLRDKSDVILMVGYENDYVGILRAAMRSPNTTVFFEHRSLLMTIDGSARYRWRQGHTQDPTEGKQKDGYSQVGKRAFPGPK